MIEGLSKLSYDDRLKQCGLTTLQQRRARGDLIQVFKMLKGFDKVDYRKYFSISNTTTRGHLLKLHKSRSRLDLRKYFFSQRVVDMWNKLPEEVVESKSINEFKNRLDKYDKYYTIK